MATGSGKISEFQKIIEIDNNTKIPVVDTAPDGLGYDNFWGDGLQFENYINRVGGQAKNYIDQEVSTERSRAQSAESALDAAISAVDIKADHAQADADAANAALPAKADKIISPRYKTLAEADVGDAIGAVAFNQTVVPATPTVESNIVFDDGSKFQVDLHYSGTWAFVFVPADYGALVDPNDPLGPTVGVTEIYHGLNGWSAASVDVGGHTVTSEANANSGLWSLATWYSGDIIENLIDVKNIALGAEATANNAAAVAAAAIPRADIVNDLTSGGASKVLSAEQGKTLANTLATEAAALTQDIAAVSAVAQAALPRADIVDDLTSGGADKALSAAQGVALLDAINTLDTQLCQSIDDAAAVAQAALPRADIVDDLTSGGADKALSAEQGVALRSRVDALENLGHYVGTFDNFATPDATGNTTVPTNIADFPGGISINDFVNVRQDETHSGFFTRYIAAAIDGATGDITFDFDVVMGGAGSIPTSTFDTQLELLPINAKAVADHLAAFRSSWNYPQQYGVEYPVLNPDGSPKLWFEGKPIFQMAFHPNVASTQSNQILLTNTIKTAD